MPGRRHRSGSGGWLGCPINARLSRRIRPTLIAGGPLRARSLQDLAAGLSELPPAARAARLAVAAA